MSLRAVALGFTASSTRKERRRSAELFAAAGVAIDRSFIHNLPKGVHLPVAPPTLEIEVSAAAARDLIGSLAAALPKVRSELPRLGLLIVVEEGQMKTWFAWRREESAEAVKAGVMSLLAMLGANGSFGWDSSKKAWVGA